MSQLLCQPHVSCQGEKHRLLEKRTVQVKGDESEALLLWRIRNLARVYGRPCFEGSSALGLLDQEAQEPLESRHLLPVRPEGHDFLEVIESTHLPSLEVVNCLFRIKGIIQ